MLKKGVPAKPSCFGLSEARLRTFAALPCLFVGSPLPRKSTCLRNPSKTNEKSMVLASLGPAWGAPGGILGGPWGRLGAPRGLPKRRLEAPFLSWTGSGGLQGPTWALEGLMTTRGDSFLLLFGLHLVYVLMFFWLCVHILSLRMLACCLLSSSRQTLVARSNMQKRLRPCVCQTRDFFPVRCFMCSSCWFPLFSVMKGHPRSRLPSPRQVGQSNKIAGTDTDGPHQPRVHGRADLSLVHGRASPPVRHYKN